jgi:two-component system chemotaxis response regulator CheB
MSAAQAGVLIVEDSETVIGLLTRAIENEPRLVLRGVARNGKQAVEMAQKLNPDVITMDIVMPHLDGVSAIREIMATAPVPIVVVTALSASEVSFEALQAGAVEVVEKPRLMASGGNSGSTDLLRLVNTIRIMADVKVVRRNRWRVDGPPAAKRSRWRVEGSVIGGSPSAARRTAVVEPPRSGLRVYPGTPPAPRLVAIAASTGGPASYRRILKGLPASFPLPILAVQHISKGFGAGLVKWLDAELELKVVLARDGDQPTAGTVYFAPDDKHLVLGSAGRLVLSGAMPVGAHRPSADVLFESVAHALGRSALGIIMTGMGSDGANGILKLADYGGYCVAQDETSSVVFGMPKSAIEAGAIHRVLSLDQIAYYLQRVGNEAAH